MLKIKSSIICTLILIVFVQVNPQKAQAQTVNCNLAGQVTTTQTTVTFDPLDNSCTLANAGPNFTLSYGMVFAFQIVGPTHVLRFYGDNDGGGNQNTSDHLGVTNFPQSNQGLAGAANVAAGAPANSSNILDGNNFVSMMTSTIDASCETATMRVDFNITNGGATFEVTVNSATVVIGSSSSGSVGSSTAVQRQAVQAAVSQQQTTVITSNIGARITNIGSPIGVSRGTPTGVGRETPGGVGRTTPGGGGTISAPDTTPDTTTDGGTGTANFSIVGNDQLIQQTLGSMQLVDAGNMDATTFMRKFALAASFYTSNMAFDSGYNTWVLGQAEGASVDDLTDAQAQRRALNLPNRPWTVWGQGSFTDAENRRNVPGDDNRYDGEVWGYNVGLDYQVSSSLYAGISVGYADTDLDTLYNDGKYSEDNISLTPYVVYTPTDRLKFSLLGGYSFGNLDQTRDNGTVTSETDSTMYYAGANASYTFNPKVDAPWEVKLNLGTSFSRKTVDAHTESDGTEIATSKSRTFQIRPGIETSYAVTVQNLVVQPFAKVDYLYDMKDTINGDENAYDIGGGVRLGDQLLGLSGSIEAQAQAGRQDYSEYTISGAIAYGFSLSQLGFNAAGSLTPFVEAETQDETRGMVTGFRIQSANGLTHISFKISHDVTTQAEDQTATDVSANAVFKF